MNTWEVGTQYSGSEWYSNPLCLSACYDEPRVVIRPSGQLLSTNGSISLFSAVVNCLGETYVIQNSTIDLQGGGDLYGSMKVGGVIELSGGLFRFQAQSNTTLDGTIKVTGGSHILPPTVTPYINIYSGEVVSQNTIVRFEGGLNLDQEGSLRFVTIGAQVIILKNFTMSGGYFTFPEVYSFLSLSLFLFSFIFLIRQTPCLLCILLI